MTMNNDSFAVSFTVNYVNERVKGFIVSGVDAEGQSKTVAIGKDLLEKIAVGDRVTACCKMKNHKSILFKVALSATKEEHG